MPMARVEILLTLKLATVRGVARNAASGYGTLMLPGRFCG